MLWRPAGRQSTQLLQVWLSPHCRTRSLLCMMCHTYWVFNWMRRIFSLCSTVTTSGKNDLNQFGSNHLRLDTFIRNVRKKNRTSSKTNIHSVTTEGFFLTTWWHYIFILSPNWPKSFVKFLGKHTHTKNNNNFGLGRCFKWVTIYILIEYLFVFFTDRKNKDVKIDNFVVIYELVCKPNIWNPKLK